MRFLAVILSVLSVAPELAVAQDDNASRLSFEICADDPSFSVATTQALFRVEVANVQALRSVRLLVRRSCGDSSATLVGYVDGEARFEGHVALADLQERDRPRAIVLSLVELLALHAPPEPLENEVEVVVVEPVAGEPPAEAVVARWPRFDVVVGSRFYSNRGTFFHGGEIAAMWKRWDLRVGVRGGRLGERSGDIGYLMTTVSAGVTLFSTREKRPLARLGFALRLAGEIGLGWARGLPADVGTTGQRTLQPTGAGYAEAAFDVRVGRALLGFVLRAGGGGGLLATVDDDRRLAAQGALLEVGLSIRL